MTQENLIDTFTIDPSELTPDMRVGLATEFLTAVNIIRCTTMNGKVTGYDVESRGGGAKPLPTVTESAAKRAKAHNRVKGGNVPLRNGIIAFHLNLHDIGDGLQWRRRGSDEAEVFFNENGGDVDWAVHFAACKTKRRSDTSVASVIGGVCLSAVRDWGGTKVEAETFIEGILENDPRRRKPAMDEVRRHIDAHPVRRRGRQDYELLAVLKDGFRKFINK